MEQSDLSTELIALAQSLDLYCRRHRIIFALDVGALGQALTLCRDALQDCQNELAPACPPFDRTQHSAKLSRIREFEARLAEAAGRGALQVEPHRGG